MLFRSVLFRTGKICEKVNRFLGKYLLEKTYSLNLAIAVIEKTDYYEDDSISDCIAFPKNNSGRDVMLDAPAALDPSQLDELNLIVDIKE